MIPATAHNDPVLISMIVPAYNEADNLDALIARVAQAIQEVTDAWELIIVNDASMDATDRILGDWQARQPHLRVLKLRQRSGQTAALAAGFQHARGTFIATLDADLQNDPADIPALLDRVRTGHCDMATGWRRIRQDNWLRRVSSRVANSVRNRLTGETIHDSACGLKVFRRSCLSAVKLYDGMHRFLPTLFRIEGFRVEQVPVHHHPRAAGTAKYGVSNRLFKALRDALAVRWMKQRTLHFQADIWESQNVRKTQ